MQAVSFHVEFLPCYWIREYISPCEVGDSHCWHEAYRIRLWIKWTWSYFKLLLTSEASLNILHAGNQIIHIFSHHSLLLVLLLSISHLCFWSLNHAFGVWRIDIHKKRTAIDFNEDGVALWGCYTHRLERQDILQL